MTQAHILGFPRIGAQRELKTALEAHWQAALHHDPVYRTRHPDQHPADWRREMEQALRKAGGSVQTLYFPNEGHGFYVPANREAYYTQLLRFLADSLGGKLASANGAEAGDPKSAASP